MSLDKKTVDKIAELAGLEFRQNEKQEILKDLNEILEFVEKINELDTEDVEPLKYVTGETNKLREDKVSEQYDKEEALKNAPLSDSDYFKVPKVIDQPNEESET